LHPPIRLAFDVIYPLDLRLDFQFHSLLVTIDIFFSYTLMMSSGYEGVE
jgi:hypothetical protein